MGRQKDKEEYMMFPCSSKCVWLIKSRCRSVWHTVHTLIIITTTIIVYTLAHIIRRWACKANTARHGPADMEKIKTLTRIDGNAMWKNIFSLDTNIVNAYSHTHTHTLHLFIAKKGCSLRGALQTETEAWSWHPAHQLCQLKHRKHSGEHKHTLTSDTHHTHTNTHWHVKVLYMKSYNKRYTMIFFPAACMKRNRLQKKCHRYYFSITSKIYFARFCSTAYCEAVVHSGLNL